MNNIFSHMQSAYDHFVSSALVRMSRRIIMGSSTSRHFSDKKCEISDSSTQVPSVDSSTCDGDSSRKYQFDLDEIHEDDVVDPITHEKLSENTFTFHPEPNVPGITYNTHSLILYLRSSRDFRDPVTRRTFSDEDRDTLASQASHLGFKEALFDVGTNEQQKVILDRRNLIRGLEAVLGELITELLTLIESKFSQMHFENQSFIIYPEFMEPFSEYKSVDIEAAWMALEGWKVFLQGPPKKPTPTSNGRLAKVLAFLDTMWTEEDMDKLDRVRQSCPNNY